MPRLARLALLAACVAVAAALLTGVAGAAWTSGVSSGPMTVSTGSIAAPSSLAVTQASCSFLSHFTIKFAWTAASPTTGVSGYAIASSSDGGSTWTTQYSSIAPASTTSYTSPNRNDWSKTYLFRISALGPGSWSATSPTVSYTTPNAFCFGRFGFSSQLASGTQTQTTDTQTSDTQTTSTETTDTTTTEG